MLTVICPQCNAVFEAPEDRVGTAVACPKCNQRLLVSPPAQPQVSVAQGPPPLPVTGGPPPLPTPRSHHQKARKFQEGLRFLELAKGNCEEGKLDETEVALALEAFDAVLRLDSGHQGALVRREEAVAILEAIRSIRREQEEAQEQRRLAAEEQRRQAAVGSPSATQPSLGRRILDAAANAAVLACGALLATNRLVEATTGRKRCLFCNEEIDAFAVRCPFCTSMQF